MLGLKFGSLHKLVKFVKNLEFGPSRTFRARDIEERKPRRKPKLLQTGRNWCHFHKLVEPVKTLELNFLIVRGFFRYIARGVAFGHAARVYALILCV